MKLFNLYHLHVALMRLRRIVTTYIITVYQNTLQPRKTSITWLEKYRPRCYVNGASHKHRDVTRNNLVENAMEVLTTLNKMKPSSAKGTYMKTITVASTMSPGVKIDPKSIK